MTLEIGQQERLEKELLWAENVRQKGRKKVKAEKWEIQERGENAEVTPIQTH